jgi:hypothetical protein
MSDFKIGDRVQAPSDSDDVGTVLGFEDGYVIVDWPIPGHPGRTDETEMDPLDLVHAEEQS